MSQTTTRSRPRKDFEHVFHVRFYCPACGEVRGPSRTSPMDYGHNGKVTRQPDGGRLVTGSRVFPHIRPYVQLLGGKRECPGGEIDPVKDRAP